MTYFVLIGSVFFGLLIVRFVNNINPEAIKLLLAFSGAYLFAISIFHIIPDIYSEKTKNIGFFIFIGFNLQVVLEFFSKGIEHGHNHINSKIVPKSMLISLGIHAYLEGMPLGAIELNDKSNEYSLLTGISLHKIPVTVVLMSLFTKANFSKLKSYVLIFFFAIMGPLGSLSGFLVKEIGNYHNEIMALVVGIFVHISTTILFENSEEHKFKIQKLFAICIAGILAWFT